MLQTVLIGKAQEAYSSLTVEDDFGVERPVSFFSQKFDSYQLNYSVIEKETLALIMPLKHFDVYVSGSAPVVVCMRGCMHFL